MRVRTCLAHKFAGMCSKTGEEGGEQFGDHKTSRGGEGGREDVVLSLDEDRVSVATFLAPFLFLFYHFSLYMTCPSIRPTILITFVVIVILVR